MTELGREPTAEEIAEVTGIEPEEVNSLKHTARAPISLEKPVGDEDESEFGQFIADDQAESPYERAVEVLTREALREALENLSYRERRILELRYGLGGETPQTLDELGRTFNVTRERIRQIENQSLKKLEHLPETQRLRDEAQTASVPRRSLMHPTWSSRHRAKIPARRLDDGALETSACPPTAPRQGAFGKLRYFARRSRVAADSPTRSATDGQQQSVRPAERSHRRQQRAAGERRSGRLLCSHSRSRAHIRFRNLGLAARRRHLRSVCSQRTSSPRTDADDPLRVNGCASAHPWGSETPMRLIGDLP